MRVYAAAAQLLSVLELTSGSELTSVTVPLHALNLPRSVHYPSLVPSVQSNAKQPFAIVTGGWIDHVMIGSLLLHSWNVVLYCHNLP